MTTIFPIDDASRIAEVRRVASTVAREEGLDEILQGRAAIVATESATNLLKHAQGGEIHIGRLSARGAAGVEILAIDRGPGIGNLDQALADGYSSGGTAGTGLGAIVRLSRNFDAYTEPGKGTIVLSQIAASEDPGRFTAGVAAKPVAGELVSGDSWAIKHVGPVTLMMVADGLGHGAHAAQASREAVAAFERGQESSPEAVLQRIHLALRGTRGAAVSVAALDFQGRQARFAGIGNVAGAIVTPAKHQCMVSHNGTAGHEVRRFHEFSYELPEHSVVVMHSDGLTGHWNVGARNGLIRRHPSVIAALLYRECARSRDDVCVLVGKGS